MSGFERIRRLDREMDLQEAEKLIEEGLRKLELASKFLHRAKHDKRFDLVRTIIDLEQIHDILTDPECTPEIKVGGSS